MNVQGVRVYGIRHKWRKKLKNGKNGFNRLTNLIHWSLKGSSLSIEKSLLYASLNKQFIYTGRVLMNNCLHSNVYLLFTFHSLYTALQWVSNTNKELSQQFCSLPWWFFFLLRIFFFFFILFFFFHFCHAPFHRAKGMMNNTTNIRNGEMSWININRVE